MLIILHLGLILEEVKIYLQPYHHLWIYNEVLGQLEKNQNFPRRDKDNYVFQYKFIIFYLSLPFYAFFSDCFGEASKFFRTISLYLTWKGSLEIIEDNNRFFDLILYPTWWSIHLLRHILILIINKFSMIDNLAFLFSPKAENTHSDNLI